jgi:amino acid adenylation domain-containing protein
MLEDSRTPLLLTQQDLLPKLPEKKPAALCIDTDWDQIAQRSHSNPSAVALPDNTAYVIYTSGSTGKPKGTSISHANVGRLFDSTDAWFNFTSDDVWTVFHSIAFDFSVWEIWGALLYGGRLVVIPYWVSRSPETFYEVLRSQNVTVLNQTPSAFRQILQIEETLQAAPLALRAVVFGGEALDIKSLAPWFERHGDLQPKLVNMYGITETTVHVTYRPLSIADTVSVPKSVIGCPIPDLGIYLLDEQMQPVPVGIPGELHVGGAGLSRGYLGQPALTAERFVPDPFSKVGGARLYKSGDLARWLPDGDIEYLGRIDHQVKVRGFRIETAEIETILASHPAVRQAVVMLRGESQESASLVGYVVARDAQLEAAEQTNACSSERVTLWQNVFEETYRQGTPEDPTFNITGWNSSYTGQPIPAEEMRSWVDETVAQILELKPSRVLEIGCGTGLLLMRVAPQCAQYVATDFSQVSLDYVAQHAANLGLKDVTLLRRMADDFESIAENSFDTVVLNSVVQYFPSVEYFVRVLEGAVRATRAGGRIFIGDIRNLDLLEAFHAGVELEHANATLGQKEVLEHIRRRIAQEEELVIDPALFRSIKQHLPKISQAEVRLKRGRYVNELTQFRYDVVLHVGGVAPRSSNIDSIDWQKGMTLPALQEAISRKGADAIVVRGVANSRLHSPVNAAEIVLRGEGVETAGAIRQTIRELPNNGIEPEDLFALGSTLGYSVSLTWTTDAKDGSYDVLLHRAEAAASFADSEEPLRAWNYYANNPLREMLSRRLVPELRRYLRSQVPEYMVPAAFMVLESMPLTAHGKIDRASLPAPSGERPKLEVPYVPATTDTEKELAKIWGDVLGVDRIGVHDNFFDLGGHSLMVIQLMSRVRKSFQVELPLRDVFGAPTIKEIAEMIEAKILAKASSEKIDQLLAQLESMDEKKAVEMLGSSAADSD